jgi:hypothetical protein
MFAAQGTAIVAQPLLSAAAVPVALLDQHVAPVISDMFAALQGSNV